MDRITMNDTAQMNSTQLSHNQVFIKDSWTLYRDFDKEVDILDLISQIANKQGVKFDSESKEELSEELSWELEFQDYADPKHILALLYRAWWSMAEVREHLSVYEDIGLEPQEIQAKLDKLAEYEKADSERRLIMLPCKVGKTVYVVTNCGNIWMTVDNETGFSDCPFESTCDIEDCEDNHIRIFETVINDTLLENGTIPRLFANNLCMTINFSDFGKTVFFKREQAEQALKEMKLEYRKRNNPSGINQLDYTVIEALKKQIPQKCHTEVINRGIDISGEYDIDNNYLCPVCKSVVGDFEADEHYYNLCPDCGQRLDWSDNNAE